MIDLGCIHRAGVKRSDLVIVQVGSNKRLRRESLWHHRDMPGIKPERRS